MSRFGVVAIGRNEGERLKLCLHSLLRLDGPTIVYVDSNSTDNSVAFARSLGVDVVELDMSVSFTAARARNAGFERLKHLAADSEFVQFVDGDCEVVPDWPEKAISFLKTSPRDWRYLWPTTRTASRTIGVQSTL